MTSDHLLLERGKLNQTCACGLTEAASGYCTRCLEATGPETWHRHEISAAQRANVTRLGTQRHSPTPDGSVTAETANPTTLTGFWPPDTDGSAA